MTRRTFLRVLGSAVAAVAVAPLQPLAPAAAVGPSWDTTPPAGALTYEMLEEAYKSACLGNRTPTYMVMSPSTFATYSRQLGLVYDVEVDEAA